MTRMFGAKLGEIEHRSKSDCGLIKAGSAYNKKIPPGEGLAAGFLSYSFVCTCFFLLKDFRTPEV